MTFYYELHVDDGERNKDHYPHSDIYLKSETPISLEAEYPARVNGKVTLREITQRRFNEMLSVAKLTAIAAENKDR